MSRPTRRTQRPRSRPRWRRSPKAASWPTLSAQQRRELAAIMLGGGGAIALICIAAPASGAWTATVDQGLWAIFGWMSALLAVLTTLLGIWLVLPGVPKMRAKWLACGALIALAITGLSSLATAGSGGLLGSAVADGLSTAMGPAAAAVVLVCAILLLAVMAYGVSMTNQLGLAYDLFSSWREQRSRLRQVSRAAVKNLQPERSRHATRIDLDPESEVETVAAPAGGASGPADRSWRQGDQGQDADRENLSEQTLMRVVAEAEDDSVVIDWKLPPLSILDSVQVRRERLQEEIQRSARTIEQTLNSFGVQAKVTGVNSGPSVTQYEVQPGIGVSVRKIAALSNDLSLALAAAPLRIETPIPGKSAVGIEVPNKSTGMVTIREVLQSPIFQAGSAQLGLALGADISGQTIVGDLTRMPHLLIAGATGSGKSVCINSIIASLLVQASPDRLRFIMVDPKRVELPGFNQIPHLLLPVLVEPEQAVAALRWSVGEMDRRYKLFATHSVRNIQGYNQKAASLAATQLSFIVIVIDELADLMMVAAGEIEELVCRIAQLARAVGIHLVVATQRPSSDIITGLIKANIPSRIAFAVSSQVDSRVILDTGGAEKLLGRGDMLYQPVDAGKPTRLQGTFVSDKEVDALTSFWKGQGHAQYHQEILEHGLGSLDEQDPQAQRRLDPLFARAARTVAAEGTASVSLVQRKFNVGYSRAGRVVDQLADHRVVGSYQGSKSREVLMNLPDVDDLLERLGLE